MCFILPVKNVLPKFGNNCFIAPNATIAGDVVLGDDCSIWFNALINDCRFNNCMHINEPGCAVKEGVNSGVIATDRYVSYLTILESIQEKAW